MASELIPIIPWRIGAQDVESVDARVLHATLGKERQYADWIRTWIRKAHLAEHRDYEVFHTDVKNPFGGRPTIEYALSIDAAKCIAMMSGGDEGDKVRAYFLARERQAITLERQTMPQVKNPANQLLIETIVRLDAVEQRALEAEQRALSAEVKSQEATEHALRAIEQQQFFTVAEYVCFEQLQPKMPESAYRALSDHLRLYCLDRRIPFRRVPVGGKQWGEEYAFHSSVWSDVFPAWLQRRYAQTDLRIVQ